MSDEPAPATPPPPPNPVDKDVPAGNDADREPGRADKLAENEAYRRGRRSLNPSGAAAFVRDSTVGDMHVGGQYNIFVGRSLRHVSGSVRDELLTWVRERYVPVPGYESMHAVLTERRLLLVHGQSGTGRATTALRLLDELTGGKVFRLQTGESLNSLTEADLEAGRGYVAELNGPEAGPLTESHLDTLSDLLRKSGCFGVLIIESDRLHGDTMGGYAIECAPPDSTELLERHLSREVRLDDPDDMQERLNDLAAAPWLRTAMGPCPRPVESARVAQLLAEHARGKLTADEVEQQATHLVHRQMIEWFAPLAELQRGYVFDDALRLAAFRIALAVFNESPYDIVAEAGGQLSVDLMEAISTTRSRRSLFADDQDRRLPAARARIANGDVVFGYSRVPVDLAEFEDNRFPRMLLSYVWLQHHNMREPIVKWLLKLSEDARAIIWVRAAQAAGLFCALDFHYTFGNLVAPGVFAEGEKKIGRRQFAAVALDQAAQDEQVRTAITQSLRYWRRRGRGAAQWTTAATLGYEIGRRSISATLEELRVIGTPSERNQDLTPDDHQDLVWVSAYSVARLFAFGEVGPVLDRLRAWARSDRHSLRELAWETLDYLIEMHGVDLLLMSVNENEHALRRSRERWPLLLALADTDPRLTAPIAELLRWSLRGKRGDHVASRIFGSWIHAGEGDQDCLAALIDFLPHLVEGDADARRLKYLVARMRRDWSDPLSPDVAAKLEQAIRMPAVQGKVS